MEEYIIITFDSSHQAIHSEKIAKSEFAYVKLIPLPSELSQGCGLCLKTANEDIQPIIELLNKNNICYSDIYRVKKINFKKTIERYFLS